MNEQDLLQSMTRRMLFKQIGYGIGGVALSNILAQSLMAASETGGLHFAPKAKRIIFMFMAGAPSHVDLLDPKPMLLKYNGQPIPEEIVKGERFAFIKGTPKLLGSPHKFVKCGKSGVEISELLPHLHTIADDITIVRSMQTDQFNHAPAQLFMNTGFQLPGRPSMGSWLTYGLGTENKDLPGFVVLLSGQSNPDGGKSCWGSGFLPTTYQGVEFRSKGDPVMYVSNPEGVDSEIRKATIDGVNELNQLHHKQVFDPEIETRINAYELAYRMQTSVPELMEIDKEPQSIHELYGTDPGRANFGNNCLLARRLAERGVRFIQLYHRGWDHHGESQGSDLNNALPALCRQTDQGAAALVKDLKQRGMLDETLVVWAGEFGRTPMNEGRGNSPYPGRDHHPKAFSIWMAGGGIKPGTVYGRTDDLGYNVVENPLHVHDLHATMLHLMGIDHTKLTFKYQGRNFRLTDVHGKVATGLFS